MVWTCASGGNERGKGGQKVLVITDRMEVHLSDEQGKEREWESEKKLLHMAWRVDVFASGGDEREEKALVITEGREVMSEGEGSEREGTGDYRGYRGDERGDGSERRYW